MKNILLSLIYLIALVGVISCDSEDDLIEDRIEENPLPAEPISGSADFAKLVTIGNSLTAGLSDGALSPFGQQYSYANILADQLKMVDGGEFVVPDIVSGNGFGPNGGRTFIDLEIALRALSGDPDVEVTDAIQALDPSPLTTSSVTGAGLNNFGVPGARIIDAVSPLYGEVNPFYANFRSSGTATMLSDAISADGTFFAVWLGANDVLGYAINGGAAGEGFTGVDPNELTSVDAFQGALTAILDGLSTNGAKGVILNIPPVTIIPFFQVVNELSPTGTFEFIELDALTAAGLNLAYQSYNDGLDGIAMADLVPGFTQEEANRRKIVFQEGTNAPVIMDESLTDLTGINPALISMRQAEELDRYPFFAAGIIGTRADPEDPTSVIGVGIPVTDSLTLTFSEQGNVIARYAAFNAAISAEAAARDNLALVDVGPIFADVFGLIEAQAAGLLLSADAQAAADGVLGTSSGGFNLVPLSLTQAELVNSLWSTDAIHPNPRGAGLITNEVISTINSEFGATIPLINPSDLPAINVEF